MPRRLARHLALAWAVTAGARAGPVPGLRVEGRTVVLAATLHPEAYDDAWWRFGGHHALTWEGGSQGHKALLRTPVPDRAVAAALAALGARDGGGVPVEAWDSRGDPASEAPDLRAEGDRLVVEVDLPGRGRVALAALLEDELGRDLDLRFVDNRRWIERFGSGCVICLSTCPGSKISNRAYTMRENHSGAMQFTARPGLPEDGAAVEVRITWPGPGAAAAP